MAPRLLLGCCFPRFFHCSSRQVPPCSSDWCPLPLSQGVAQCDMLCEELGVSLGSHTVEGRQRIGATRCRGEVQCSAVKQWRGGNPVQWGGCWCGHMVQWRMRDEEGVFLQCAVSLVASALPRLAHMVSRPQGTALIKLYSVCFWG